MMIVSRQDNRILRDTVALMTMLSTRSGYIRPTVVFHAWSEQRVVRFQRLESLPWAVASCPVTSREQHSIMAPNKASASLTRKACISVSEFGRHVVMVLAPQGQGNRTQRASANPNMASTSGIILKRTPAHTRFRVLLRTLDFCQPKRRRPPNPLHDQPLLPIKYNGFQAWVRLRNPEDLNR